MSNNDSRDPKPGDLRVGRSGTKIIPAFEDALTHESSSTDDIHIAPAQGVSSKHILSAETKAVKERDEPIMKSR